MTVRDRTAGYMPGQAGVLGIDFTARYAKSMMADSRLLYVNPNHDRATDNGNTGEDPECPFATVAAALLRCRDNRGDVIFVGQNDDWQYGGGSDWNTAIEEEITVTVDGISIVGTSPGGLGVYWSPVTAGGLGTCITVYALDVLIEGIAFVGGTPGGRAIYCEWDGMTLYGENTVVRNCFFDDDIDIGIQLEFAWNCEISHCNFQECDDAGIYVDPGGSGAEYNRIHHNIFHNILGAGAISMQGGAHNHIWANTIYNSEAQSAAVATDEGIDLTVGSCNLVYDNYFSCVLPAGANGDWDDLNTGTISDSWVGNWTTNGMAVTMPT